MSAITGIGTTFGLPNYHGELFGLSPETTPLLSAIGGLTGGGQTTDTQAEWQTYDLRDPSQRTRLEGATAPTSEERVRANVSNVLEIHQEQVSASYTKQAATGAAAGLASGANPVTDELGWQVEQALKQIARDVNFSFINGIYHLPTANTTARRTRGLLAAVHSSNLVDQGTNVATGASSATDTITPASAHSLSVGDQVVFTSVGDMDTVVVGRRYYVVAVSTTVSFKVSSTSGGTAITVGTSTEDIDYHSLTTTALALDDIESLIQTVWDNGGLDENGTILVNSGQKRAISAVYAAAYGKANPLISGERIGGVAVDQIETDFGRLNIMLDRSVPVDTICVTSLSQLMPVFMNIPGKGVFFQEQLAKTGASDAVQLYGEIGLKYGSPLAHGWLRGLPVV